MAPPPASQHGGDLIFHTQPGIGQAHFQRLVEHLALVFVNRPGAATQCRAVAGNIQAAIGGNCSLYHRFDGLFPADIAMHESGGTAGVLNQPYRFPARFLVEVGNDDTGALAGIGQCDSPSNALTRAGDNACLVFKYSHADSPQ